jgi:hypothetical protein
VCFSVRSERMPGSLDMLGATPIQAEDGARQRGQRMRLENYARARAAC